MKFSELWLKEKICGLFINSSMLHKQLTEFGFEVEKIYCNTGNFDNIIVGEIIFIEKKKCLLQKKYVYQINIGNNNIINYWYSKNNLKKHDKVVVFDTNQTNNYINIIKVKNKKLYSYNDLSVPYGNDEVIILPNTAVPGESAKKYFVKSNNNTIKINIPANRFDVMSIFGLSREIFTINKLIPPKLEKIKIHDDINDRLKVNFKQKSGCVKYVGRIIKNVNLKVATPFWMQEKLRYSGVYSTNIITDVINYVLLEIGEPIHIINMDMINNSVFFTQTEENNFILLNKKKKKLKKNISVLRDEKQILLLSNNLVLDNFSTNNNNIKNIFLGSISLLASQLIKNSVMTDQLDDHIINLYKYPVNIYHQIIAINYATKLIKTICSGQIGPISEYCNKEYCFNKINSIKLYHKKLNDTLGYFVNSSVINKIFTVLGYKVSFFEKGWVIFPPYWRSDILSQEDAIADFIRIYGYENIIMQPLKILPIQKKIEKKTCEKKIRNILIARGYSEVINYSFVNPKLQALINPNISPLLISNPMSQDMSSMRFTLWVGLIQSAIYNQNRQQHLIRLLETGLCFVPDLKKKSLFKEELHLAGLVTGSLVPMHWDMHDIKLDFYHIKGDIETIFGYYGLIKKIRFISDSSILGLDSNCSAFIYLNNNKIGVIGALDPILEKKFQFNSRVYLFDLFLDDFVENKKNKICEIKYFPRSQRDISIVVNENIQYDEIISICTQSISKHKVEFNIFDLYRGKKIEIGKKSISINILFFNEKGDLTEDKINILMNKIILDLSVNLKAILRK
ncbi:Phenylalanine--tRNA ligase beta subunit [Buchnera aphidicola (Thelaxes suberi)]|uniref:phenylalanine--tRNA ligase subunit beta n=1 Tax=Buchnera aphidicola TaxID=9 RepID=UPI0034646018